MTLRLFIFGLSLFTVFLSAQSITGRVQDRSQQPVPSAMIFLSGDSSRFTLSDSAGYFRLEPVAEGRRLLVIRKVGFIPVSDEVLITSGKSIVRVFTMEESNVLLEQVGVTAGRPAVSPGSYGISIEKTLRMPANFFDPLRLASVLPAVASGNDQANGIAFRGYSPNGLLWRLEGMDIVNPNHLANAGTLSDRPVANGGGVSILSSQVLDRSEFNYGILPASAGNALSGMMDMSLRKGNHQGEYTVQAGLIGTDLAAEGRLGRSDRTTWLANLRYSTVGLLSKAGVDFGGEAIDFADMSFHIRSDHTAGGGLSVFGFAGSSSNVFRARPQAEWETEKDRYDIDYTGRTMGIGFRDSRVLRSGLSLDYGAIWSKQKQDRDADSAPFLQPHIDAERFSQTRELVSGMVKLKTRISGKVRNETGAVLTASEQQLSLFASPTVAWPDRFSPILGKINGILLQPYTAMEAAVGPVRFNAAIRWVHFSWNNTGGIEPRISATLALAGGQLTAGYGRTSQLQQVQVYLAGNSGLPMTRSGQWYAEYARAPSSGLQWRLSAYHHRVSAVPLYEGSSPAFGVPLSGINLLEETGVAGMKPVGTGRNIGLEGMVEKRFDSRWYLLASGSVMDARYGLKGSGNPYQSRFNARHTFAVAAGKEWTRTKNDFGLHLKAVGYGGQRERVIDAVQSQALGTTIYDLNRGYDVALPDYFRTDLRASWRRNKSGRTRTLSIDIQNLLNAPNVAGNYFDTFLGKVTRRYQLGIIPVLTWRLDF